MTTEGSQADNDVRKAAEGSWGDRVLMGLVERIGGRAGVQAAFGESIRQGDLTVIPVARVRWGFGGGGGSAGDVGGSPQAGSGSGGGGGVAVDPIGYLEVRPEGAVFRPIVSQYPSPLFLLAASMTAAIVLRALARLIRR